MSFISLPTSKLHKKQKQKTKKTSFGVRVKIL